MAACIMFTILWVLVLGIWYLKADDDIARGIIAIIAIITSIPVILFNLLAYFWR